MLIPDAAEGASLVQLFTQDSENIVQVVVGKVSLVVRESANPPLLSEGWRTITDVMRA